MVSNCLNHLEKAKTRYDQFPSVWNDNTMDAFILDTV